MSLGSPPSDDATTAPAPGPELGGALPVRVRSPRGGAGREVDAAPGECFAGCPLFPVDGTDARGTSYREKFLACGFTQEDAESQEIGLRIRLESPDGRAGGTSKATFPIPLLPLSTTQEAIHDRWGPGKYEITLCRRSSNDRIKSSAKSISRNVTLLPRRDPEFGPEGEFDVGDEAWPIDPDDGNLTTAMRAEMERREEIREELAAQDAQDRGAFRDDARGRPDPYAGAPQHPPAFGAPPAMDPRTFPPGTTFTLDAMGRPVPAPPAKPSAATALLDSFATNPLSTITTIATAAAGLKSALGLDRPPPPSAQEIAAATTAALAPVLEKIASLAMAKPAGPDPMEVFKAQLAAEREAADRRAAEAREAAARADAERERRESEARVRAAQEVAERERKWELQIERLRADGRAREIEAQLAAAKNAGEAEKSSLLKELADLRQKLRTGDEEAAPGLIEQMGDFLDTKFGEAVAPFVGPAIARAIDAVASGGPAPQPAPQQPVVPVFTAPQQYPALSAAPAPAIAPDESADADEDPSEVE
jgi:hypothetical protein